MQVLFGSTPGTNLSILDDGLGHFWLSSNRGVFRISKNELSEVADEAAGPRSSAHATARSPRAKRMTTAADRERRKERGMRELLVRRGHGDPARCKGCLW